MQYVEFIGDVRYVAARAIEAATGEVVPIDKIYTPTELTLWRNKPVNFFCPQVREHAHGLLHYKSLWRMRPWSAVYPDALSICRDLENVGIHIVTCESYDEWAVRVLKGDWKLGKVMDDKNEKQNSETDNAN